MFLVILLYFLIAGTFTIGKMALSYMSPFLFIGMRMTIAGVVLALYSWIKRHKHKSIEKSDIYLFAQIILFHIYGAYMLEFWALAYVTSAKACLLYNLSPFITAVFCFILFNEKLSVRQICGLILGFLGFLPILMAETSLEIMTKYSGFLSLPELALLVSVTFSAYGWMVMKKLINKRYSVVFVNSIGMLGGGILAFLTSLWVEGYPMIRDTEVTMQWVANYYGIFTEKIVMLGIYSGLLIIIANIICYNLYGYLLSRYSATFLSFVGFMTPLFAALLGWIYLGEPVTWHFFATLLIVLCGLSLFHTKQVIEFEERGL